MNSQISLLNRIKLKGYKFFLTRHEFYLFHFTFKGFLKETGWFLSMDKKQSINVKGEPMPWITYPAYYFLDGKGFDALSVFEYGSGNSTFYYNSKGANVYSVEHHEGWFNIVKSKLTTKDQIYLKSITDEKGINEYINSIELPDKKYDVIVVDGRFRRRCMIMSVNFLKDSGVIILDNSERQYYKEGMNFLIENGFRKIDFWGLSPINYSMSCTTIFYRNGNCMNI